MSQILRTLVVHLLPVNPFLFSALAGAVTGFTAGSALGQDSLAGDGLTATVASMKHSIARLVCATQLVSPVPAALGSAFFVSPSGTFLTAAHVFEEISGQPNFCRFAAVSVPIDTWNPQLREEFQAWFEFRPSDCKIDVDLDVARCHTIVDLSKTRSDVKFAVRPANLDWSSPPDGSEVGVIGFPLGSRDPMTSRAAVSTTRVIWREGRSYPELLLDRPSWPGSSGSPVFLPDGRVVGIVVGTGTGDTTGLTVARPAAAFRRLADDRAE